MGSDLGGPRAAIRGFFKLSVFLVVLGFYLSFGFFLRILLRKNEKRRRLAQARLTSLFSQFILFIFRIRLSLKGSLPSDLLSRPRLLIGNHLTYLDILVVASHMTSIFVTSEDAKESFLGPLMETGGSIFVERRHPYRLLKDLKNVARLLRMGVPVCVFPEATSSNGERMLPFKRGLFESGLHAETSILPICISYRIKGERLNLQTSSIVCYFGDHQFASHLWNFVKLSGLEATLEILPEISLQDESCNRLVKEKIEHVIAAAYEPHRSTTSLQPSI